MCDEVLFVHMFVFRPLTDVLLLAVYSLADKFLMFVDLQYSHLV